MTRKKMIRDEELFSKELGRLLQEMNKAYERGDYKKFAANSAAIERYRKMRLAMEQQDAPPSVED